MIIKLPYDPTKFKSISINLYFIDCTSINDNQSIPEDYILLLIQAPVIKKGPAEAFLTEKFPIHALAISTSLAFLALVKRGRKQLRKYLKQVNIMS